MFGKFNAEALIRALVQTRDETLHDETSD